MQTEKCGVQRLESKNMYFEQQTVSFTLVCVGQTINQHVYKEILRHLLLPAHEKKMSCCSTTRGCFTMATHLLTMPEAVGSPCYQNWLCAGLCSCCIFHCILYFILIFDFNSLIWMTSSFYNKFVCFKKTIIWAINYIFILLLLCVCIICCICHSVPKYLQFPNKWRMYCNTAQNKCKMNLDSSIIILIHKDEGNVCDNYS